jgi:protein gp37
MGDKTGIEWTDATWNPTTGCDKVSPGCDNCYAMTLAPRLKAMGSAHYQRDGDPKTSGPGFGISMHPDGLDKPLRWTRPRKIFVNSMSDLFHSGVTDEFIADVFIVMAIARQLTFQVLTKRPGRMRSLLSSPRFLSLLEDAAKRRDRPFIATWPLPNVWLGTSVEDQKRADLRIPPLLDTPAAVRFLSMEPLIGEVSFRWAKWVPAINGNHLDGLKGIGWVIVGGESGPGARPMDADLVRRLRDQCVEAGVPFHFKQWGSHDEHGVPTHKKVAGRMLDGRTWDEWPEQVYRPATTTEERSDD